MDLLPIIEELKEKYKCYRYHMLLFNCNHFSDELVRRLTANRRGIPGWVNRAAFLGSWFHMFVPFKYVTVGTPEGKEREIEQKVKAWI